LPLEYRALNTSEPIPWRGFRALDKVIIFALPLLAIASLAIPFLDQAALRRLGRLPGLGSFFTWLAGGNNAWVAGIVILFLLVLFIVWRRWRIISDKRLWFGTGCPNCRQRELVRVSRHGSDRFYGLVGIPAYRYACRDCSWRGLRIARREHSPERELELEEALLRFEPASPSASPRPVSSVNVLDAVPSTADTDPTSLISSAEPAVLDAEDEHESSHDEFEAPALERLADAGDEDPSEIAGEEVADMAIEETTENGRVEAVDTTLEETAVAPPPLEPRPDLEWLFRTPPDAQ
jgi:hypothetical protein